MTHSRIIALRLAAGLGLWLGPLAAGLRAQEPTPRDTARPAPQQPTFQSLNPDISAIGELLTDLSPTRPEWIESGSRFEVREVELGIQAIVDPFFRADFFLGFHPEAVEVEEAYVTALALPGGLQAKLGRFLMPFGKVNLTHRPELTTVDYPLVIQEFFGEEGFASNGVWLSKLLAPFGFYQELQLNVVSGIEREAHEHGAEEGAHEKEAGEGLEVFEREREGWEQLAALAHLRNYWDLSPAANVELGFSAAIGSVERLREVPCTDVHEVCIPEAPPVLAASFEAQRFYGADLTVRWRPLRQGLYRSFVWNTEVAASDAPEAVLWGGFTQARWQLARRWYLGGRLEGVQQLHEHEADEGEGEEEEEWLWATSGYLTFFPSEFSQFKLAVEKRFGEAAQENGDWRAVLQTTFAIGPHRPHGF